MTPTMRDLIESVLDHGKPLEGTWISPEQMLPYFPGVEDEAKFAMAWRKVMRNEEERLTRTEMWELARAFISFVRLDKDSKLELIRKLANIHGVDGAVDKIDTTNL